MNIYKGFFISCKIFKPLTTELRSLPTNNCLFGCSTLLSREDHVDPLFISWLAGYTLIFAKFHLEIVLTVILLRYDIFAFHFSSIFIDVKDFRKSLKGQESLLGPKQSTGRFKKINT